MEDQRGMRVHKLAVYAAAMKDMHKYMQVIDILQASAVTGYTRGN